MKFSPSLIHIRNKKGPNSLTPKATLVTCLGLGVIPAVESTWDLRVGWSERKGKRGLTILKELALVASCG